jgi:hypothetical protein
MTTDAKHVDPALFVEMMVTNKLAVHVIDFKTRMVGLNPFSNGSASDEYILLLRYSP